MATFNLYGGARSDLAVSGNSFNVNLESDAGILPSDTTGTTTLDDVQVGDTLNLELDAYGEAWDGTTYTKPVTGYLWYYEEEMDPDTGEPIEETLARFNLNSGQSTITLDNVETETINLTCTVTSVSVSGTTYTLGISFGAPTPTYANSFAIGDYEAGDTIALKSDGSPETLAVTFEPSGSTVYDFTAQSSSNSVATVSYSNGQITVAPVAAGTATLTATLIDGSDMSTVTHNYTIKVSDPIPEKALGGNAISFLKDKIEASTITVVQSTGQSTEDVMSQKAVTDTIGNRLGGLTLLSLTQSEYDNLQTKDPDTLYIIKADE